VPISRSPTLASLGLRPEGRRKQSFPIIHMANLIERWCRKATKHVRRCVILVIQSSRKDGKEEDEKDVHTARSIDCLGFLPLCAVSANTREKMEEDRNTSEWRGDCRKETDCSKFLKVFPHLTMKGAFKMKNTGIWSLICVICLMVSLIVPFSSTKVRAAKKYTVCITQIVTHPDLDTGRKGFIEGMKAQGFKEGENINYVIRNAEGDMHVAASIAKYFVSIKPDLIASITTPSSQAMVGAAEGTDIPIVFFLVTDPVAAGLVPSWTKAGPNVTGVSDWADVPTQIRYIKEIMPNIKTLGIIFNAGEVNSRVQRDEVVQFAPTIGLKVVEANAPATAEVYAAASSLIGRADAMWFPTDNTVFAAIDSVLKVAEEQKIPAFGSAVGQVESGCAAGAGVDIKAIGREASLMAGKILRGEAKPSEISPMKTKVMIHAVNLPAAKRMGLNIPQSVIDKADIVFK
jgi:putative ABC transport system substrate-binding protein